MDIKKFSKYQLYYCESICEKGCAKRKKLLETCESIYDAAYDMWDFLEQCSDFCSNISKGADKMSQFKNNGEWFAKQPKDYQEYIFKQFEGNFQSFLSWCAEPYKNELKDIKIWLKQN